MATKKLILWPVFGWKVTGVTRTPEGRIVGTPELIYVEFGDTKNFYWKDEVGQLHQTPRTAFISRDMQHDMGELLLHKMIHKSTKNQPRLFANKKEYEKAHFDKAGNQLFWFSGKRQWVTIPTD